MELIMRSGTNRLMKMFNNHFSWMERSNTKKIYIKRVNVARGLLSPCVRNCSKLDERWNFEWQRERNCMELWNNNNCSSSKTIAATCKMHIVNDCAPVFFFLLSFHRIFAYKIRQKKKNEIFSPENKKKKVVVILKWHRMTMYLNADRHTHTHTPNVKIVNKRFHVCVKKAATTMTTTIMSWWRWCTQYLAFSIQLFVIYYIVLCFVGDYYVYFISFFSFSFNFQK